MAAETLSCPYCNSSVTLLRPAATGQRLRCPRCHELIPHPAGEAGAKEANYGAALDPREARAAFGDAIEGPSPRSWSNRSVALIILSVMGGMAAIGFTFAWFTTETRRQRDHHPESAAQPAAEILSVAPAKLAALGYLPAGMDAIAGIHVAELMARPETALILRQMRADRANFATHRLEQLTGFTLEELDHVLLGIKIKDEVLGRVYLVVQTRQPYDVDKLRETLHVGRSIKLTDKMVYHAALEQTELRGALWYADARTLVFALQPKDLEEIPAQAVAGVDRFSVELQGLVTGLKEGTQAWVVGAPTNWETTLFLLQGLGLADDSWKALSQVHTFSGRLQCDKEIKAQVEITCSSEAGAEELDRFLVRNGLEANHLVKLAEERPRAAALLTDLARSLARERNREHLHVQAKASWESVRLSFPHRSVGARAAQ